MMNRRLAFPALVLLLVATAATAQVASSCNCANGGTHDTSRNDRCLCTCPTGFARPRCELRDTDLAAIRVIFVNRTQTNASAPKFTSSAAIFGFQRHFGLPETSEDITVWRREVALEPANKSDIWYLFRVRARIADTFVDDAIRGDPDQWLTPLGVRFVSSYVTEDAPSGEFAKHAVLYSFETDIGALVITANAIIFLIVPLMFCNCCFVVETMSSRACQNVVIEDDEDDEMDMEEDSDDDYAPGGASRGYGGRNMISVAPRDDE